VKRAPPQQRPGDDAELVLAEAPLGAEEGGRAGQLPDREFGDRLGLPGRANRLVALGLVKAVGFALVDQERRRQ
jgi:hypothetical protein